MIIMKMHEGKWRIQIEKEEWEFENRNDLKEVAWRLIEMKDKYGRINKKNDIRWDNK